MNTPKNDPQRFLSPVRLLGYWVVSLMILSASLVQAREVSLEFRGLTINANLEIAEGQQISDDVILIIHGFMSHNRMELVQASQAAFLENGHNSLAINLSLGVDNRWGFYDCMVPIRHRLVDAVAEFDVWIDWLKQQGVKKIRLMGHSLSANQILLYMAERKMPEIAGLILLAPNTLGHPGSRERFFNDHGGDLNASLEQAIELIEVGKPKELMKETDYGFCPKATVTAEAFHDLYQKGTGFWTAHLMLPKVDIPVLVVGAEMDERQASTEEHVMPYVDNERVFFTLIEGSGHFFRDLNMDDAIEAAVEFLEKTGGG